MKLVSDAYAKEELVAELTIQRYEARRKIKDATLQTNAPQLSEYNSLYVPNHHKIAYLYRMDYLMKK